MMQTSNERGLLALLRVMSPGSWSIWVRLIVVALGAVLVPLIISTLVFAREVRSVDSRNLEAFIQDSGNHRAEDLNAFFAQIRSELIFFAESEVYSRRLEQVLLFQTNPNLNDILIDYFDERLVGQGLMTDAVLFRPDGQVILSNTSARTGGPSVESGTDLSFTQLFRVATNAATLGDVQRVAVNTDADNFRVQIVQVVYDRDQIIGFVGGTINSESLLEYLEAESDFIVKTRSYLVSANGDLVSPLENMPAARRSVAVAPINDALAGISDVSRYKVGDEDMIAFLSPIDSSFALVIEASADTSFTLALDDIYGSGVLIVIIAIFLASLLGLATAQTIVAPLRSLGESVSAIQNSDFDRDISTAARRDEIGYLARNIVNLRAYFYDVFTAFEARVQLRTRDIEATQEVSRFAATQRDLQALMDRVVSLIVERFPNIYHAQIFLLDQSSTYAILRASTGEAGRRLLERGHRLEVGGVSVIGQVTGDSRVVVARDTSDSDIHKRNEFLPDTRAELAIPLHIGDRVIGALDVQSRQNDTFAEDQVRILQTMADQIAIAIENARLYQESLSRIEEITESNRKNTLKSWREHMNYRRQRSVGHHVGARTTTDLSPLRQAAVTSGKPAVGAETPDGTIPFAVPIQLRGQILGAVQWEVPADTFSDYKVQLAQELVNRLALSLENARLFQESTQAINRERLVNDIATKLTAQTDIDEILKTAVREVGKALSAPQVNIDLLMGTVNGASNGAPNGASNGNGNSAEHEDDPS